MNYGNRVWSEKFEHGWGVFPSEEVVRFLSGVATKDVCVDIGAGVGNVCWTACKLGYKEVIGLDGALNGLERIQSVCKMFGVADGPRLIHCDITDPPEFSQMVEGEHVALVDHFALCCNSLSQILSAWHRYFQQFSSMDVNFFWGCFGDNTDGAETANSDLYADDLTSGPLAGSGSVQFMNERLIGQMLGDVGFISNVQIKRVTEVVSGFTTEKFYVMGRRDAR